MKIFIRLFLHFLAFAVLTIFTQVGGIIYLVSLLLRPRLQQRYAKWLVFPLLYAIIWWILPFIAAPFGRVPLPVRATKAEPIQAQSWLLVAANRHYVKPSLRVEAMAVAQQFAKRYNGTPITYLDANFPFFDGFPLLPHRSHNDGEKLDLAFVYQKEGQRRTNAPAFLGYGRLAVPLPSEIDQPARCAKKGYWQYSLLRYLAQPFLGKNYTLDEKASADLVRFCAKRKRLHKLLIEPHLKQRWRLNRWHKIRYHGCAAVRHDDHLHVQL